jgi:iron complex outermembrane receptor protein
MMVTKRNIRSDGRAALLAATIASSLLPGVPALAQTATGASAAVTNDSELLPDIIVTAQRRKESSQNVPIAVSAFSADLLSQRGIATPLQLIQYVPNLFGSNNTGLGSANAYYIRGLGNTETIATFDPPVGTYVDDIYMSRQNGNNFAFFDLDRIEVLRGPQGTLFGRNTTGGAVNVIMKRPSDTLGGFLEAAYGSYDKKLIRGSIDLPLNEMVQVKISGYFQDDDGYAINTKTGERNNDSDLAGLRGALQLKLTENLTWNVAGTYMRNDGENLINFNCDPLNPANCNGRFNSTGIRTKYGPGTTTPFSTLGISGRKANYGLGNKTDTQMYTSNLELALGEDFTLNAITGFINLKQQYLLDFADGRGLPSVANPFPVANGYPTGGFVITNDGKHNQFTQELKLNGKVLDGRVEFVTGFYYFDENNTTDFADVFNLGPIFGIPGPTGFPAVLADRTLINTATAKAGYFQADFNVTDELKLTGGIRYTDEKKTISIFDNRATCSTPRPTCLTTANLAVDLPTGRLAIPTAQRTKIWTPRFAINYKPNNDMLFFASATRGFKSGGWNARGSAPNTLLPFDPEKVWSYEVGGKTEWFNRRLRLNVTGFWLETKDLQTPSAFVDPVSGGVTFITQNFADYQNKGLEVEISAVPVKGLTLYANAGYQDDKYKVSETLLPNKYGVKSVRKQQIDCLAQLAAKRVPLGAGANNAPDCAAGIIDANGNIATPVRTPDFSIAFGGSYDFAIPSAGVILTPSVNALYRASLETGTAGATIYTGTIATPSGVIYPANPFGGDVIAGSLTESFWQVSAALTMRTDDNNWTLSLECENCFDKQFSQSSLVNFNYLNPPRTWQIRAKRVF